ncbi:hypothetical protein [Aliarcobacter butzleri]|uniref:hypothetical protein n=1 Tax=Aliarcobacter butzleri TaxID=28197 RepID=UPI002B2495BD|nr:hypothetical protein [Aliarcobacter butzleri]
MLEAIKILENLKNSLIRNEGILNLDVDYSYVENIKKAIEELEALENRSCNNCKYVFSDTLGLIYCSSPKSPLSSCVFPIHPKFSCNKWEVKNEF